MPPIASQSIFPRPACRIPICSAKNQSGVARIHLFMVGSLNFWKAFNLNWTELRIVPRRDVHDGRAGKPAPAMQSSKRVAKSLDLRRFVSGPDSEWDKTALWT